MHLQLVALRNLAVLPDVADVDLDDDLPRSFFDATCENRVWVARRRVAENEINLRGYPVWLPRGCRASGSSRRLHRCSRSDRSQRVGAGPFPTVEPGRICACPRSPYSCVEFGPVS